MKAIERAGYKPGENVGIALDPASTEFFKDGKYYPHLPDHAMTSNEMVALYEGLCNNYPIVSIEDGLAEDDWAGWSLLTERIGKKIQLVGDDLFVTNVERLVARHQGRRRPTRSSSRSTRSARSPKRSTPSRWRTRPVSAP